MHRASDMLRWCRRCWREAPTSMRKPMVALDIAEWCKDEVKKKEVKATLIGKY